MHDLASLCALGGTEPQTHQVAGVTLTENPGYALASIAARLGQESACASHLAQLLGTDAPAVGKAVQGNPEMVFWTGPDQWMVAAPFDSHEDLATQLKTRFGGTASITEQSDGWVWFDMQGTGIDQVMQLCCNIDIARMQVGDAARTVIHYMGVYVICTAPDALSVVGGRSSAKSLHHALVTAMKAAL